MSQEHFRITRVEVRDESCLYLTFHDGASFDVRLREWIETTPALEPLKNAAFFARAGIGEHGWCVTWDDEETIALAGDNLRNLGVEQAGGIGHERIWEWMHRHGLTVDAASEALGLSPRMIAYYRSGQKPIPRHVWLACLGWESLQKGHRKAA
ncbi:MAG TPA: DUF2442 domain-containing protein [Candidatus Ozemobacteraceae bacterium]|nr:DUF2442 domain-containing protein [Candidatus Ozemobacteraceae bacterium]